MAVAISAAVFFSLCHQKYRLTQANRLVVPSKNQRRSHLDCKLLRCSNYITESHNNRQSYRKITLGKWSIRFHLKYRVATPHYHFMTQSKSETFSSVRSEKLFAKPDAFHMDLKVRASTLETESLSKGTEHG